MSLLRWYLKYFDCKMINKMTSHTNCPVQMLAISVRTSWTRETDKNRPTSFNDHINWAEEKRWCWWWSFFSSPYEALRTELTPWKSLILNKSYGLLDANIILYYASDSVSYKLNLAWDCLEVFHYCNPQGISFDDIVIQSIWKITIYW